ncbi:MAG: sodium ion-translocating decarboxylase subunit beta [Ruminococcaceae bacterium]|nr:sodium ion-translocating decarboxylase subunit beta [Oscillospiraceae bacterium]
MDIKSFKKTKIDLSLLGFDMNGDFELYYCTPKKAQILASSGVDGIHYCIIPQFGEIIFAVSPMNFGDCVHPIARNFEDLLCLLLHCGDIAALEQCYAWDEEQYKAFLTDNPATEKQQAVLSEIKSKCGLEPISDSFAYVKELQAEFDLSQIPYTEDYYDPEMNAAAPEVPAEWAVYFEHGFWNKNAKGKPGEEIVLNKTFSWGDEIWHIPAVYSCSKGLVIDFCVEIQPEKEKAFIDKWYPTLEKDERLTREAHEQMDQENPMEIGFRPCLFVNGKEIIAKHGTSISWIPESCLPDGVIREIESKEIIKHYGLDETRAWSFHRWSCPWATKRKPEIKSIKLKLERDLTAIQGIHFKNPSVGDVITFVHPVRNTEHKLTVLGYEKQEFSGRGFQHEKYEFPTLHTAMTYTLEPALPGRNFGVRDCVQNEQPRRKPRNQFEPQAKYDACAIAIIGGADGPTAFFVSGGQNLEQHCALSALRFAYADDIEWKIVFREKLMEDIETELL